MNQEPLSRAFLRTTKSGAVDGEKSRSSIPTAVSRLRAHGISSTGILIDWDRWSTIVIAWDRHYRHHRWDISTSLLWSLNG